MNCLGNATCTDCVHITVVYRKVILLVVVNLFTYNRSADIPTRQRYVALVDKVKDTGGNVRYAARRLFISNDNNYFLEYSLVYMYQENVSETKKMSNDICFIELGLLTGVAAILRFPLPEEQNEDSDED